MWQLRNSSDVKITSLNSVLLDSVTIPQETMTTFLICSDVVPSTIPNISIIRIDV